MMTRTRKAVLPQPALRICSAAFLAIVLSTGMVATLGACAPTHESFLQDASSTCGNPDLVFPERRDFNTHNKPADINKAYDCVQNFLLASPEYQRGMTGKENDAGYVDAMRRIDLARTQGQISPEEAKAESLRLYQRYEAAVGE